MWNILLWPVKVWYTILLVVLIADKIVAMTPVPWDDLIVTSVKKLVEKVQGMIDNFIASIVIKPVSMFFNKDKELKCVCGKNNCCK